MRTESLNLRSLANSRSSRCGQSIESGEGLIGSEQRTERSNNRAMILSSRAQYKQAVDDLLNAARFKPQDPEPHFWLGELYESKFEDRIILAMDHYEKYVELGGLDPTVREKVKVWKDLKKRVGNPAPAPSAKMPTAEDEAKAAELHLKALDLLKQADKSEAVKVMEDLLINYGHTKYVQEKARALQAAVAAFKKKDAPK